MVRGQDQVAYIGIRELKLVNPVTGTTLEGRERDLALAEIQEGELASRVASRETIDWIRLLWDGRVLLVKVTLAALVISTVLVFFIPDSYDSYVQLMPPDSSSISGGSGMLGMLLGGGISTGSSSGGSSSGSSLGSGLAGTVNDLLGGQKLGPLFIGILTSRTISDRIIDRFDLRKVYWKKTYAAARKKLLSRVQFTEDKKSGIIKINVEDRDRKRATAMAQAYVDELNTLLAQVNTSAASREREFLENRLTVVHGELEKASKDLSEFSSHNATLDPEDQAKAMLESAATLEGQLIAAKSELSGLQQIYTNENVRVRSLQAHIAELEQQLNNFGGKAYSGSTALDPNSLYPPIRQLPVLGRQYLDLYRTVKIDETVYEMLTESYEMAKVEEAKETPSVKVLDAAKIPERKSWPPRPWLALLGAALGFLLGSAWIGGNEYWSAIDPNEPRKLLLTEMLTDLKCDWAQVRGRLRTLKERNHLHRSDVPRNQQEG